MWKVPKGMEPGILSKQLAIAIAASVFATASLAVFSGDIAGHAGHDHAAGAEALAAAPADADRHALLPVVRSILAR